MVRGSNESLELAGIFSTYPNAHISVGRAFPVETVIAAILMCLIPALTDDGNGIPRGPLAPLLIGILIAVIGASMGPLTGFALNPARDFGPKLFAYRPAGASRLHRRTRHPVLRADLSPLSSVVARRFRLPRADWPPPAVRRLRDGRRA